MKQTILRIALSIVIIILGYMVVQSIMAPVHFENKKAKREKVVIDLLKDLRTTQLAYKSIHNSYTASFDTLVDFVKNGEIPVVNIIPDPTDTTFTKTINDTIAYINVGDSIFKKWPNFRAEDVRFIPFSNGIEFTMNAGLIEKASVEVNVFEISAPYQAILYGMDEQLIANLIKKQKEYEKFPGLKVGSMTEPSTDGNWEF